MKPLPLLTLFILLCALVLLLYAWWPVPTVREQFEPDPTLFAPPHGMEWQWPLD